MNHRQAIFFTEVVTKGYWKYLLHVSSKCPAIICFEGAITFRLITTKVNISFKDQHFLVGFKSDPI